MLIKWVKKSFIVFSIRHNWNDIERIHYSIKIYIIITEFNYIFPIFKVSTNSHTIHVFKKNTETFLRIRLITISIKKMLKFIENQLKLKYLYFFLLLV